MRDDLSLACSLTPHPLPASPPFPLFIAFHNLHPPSPLFIVYLLRGIYKMLIGWWAFGSHQSRGFRIWFPEMHSTDPYLLITNTLSLSHQNWWIKDHAVCHPLIKMTTSWDHVVSLHAFFPWQWLHATILIIAWHPYEIIHCISERVWTLRKTLRLHLR